MACNVAVGVYRSEKEAVSAIRRLLEMGYTAHDVFVLAHHPDRFESVETMTDVFVEAVKAIADTQSILLSVFIDLGFSDQEARFYELALYQNDLLVLVETDQAKISRVKDIFRYTEEEYYLYYRRETIEPSPADSAEEPACGSSLSRGRICVDPSGTRKMEGGPGL